MRVVYRFEFQKATYLHESFNMCIHLPPFLLDQQDQFSQSFAVIGYSNPMFIGPCIILIVE